VDPSDNQNITKRAQVRRRVQERLRGDRALSLLYKPDHPGQQFCGQARESKLGGRIPRRMDMGCLTLRNTHTGCSRSNCCTCRPSNGLLMLDVHGQWVA
jgi:hypothetical protein